eukprot:9077372-Pyramimonas_sp.AAC.1
MSQSTGARDDEHARARVDRDLGHVQKAWSKVSESIRTRKQSPPRTSASSTTWSKDKVEL